MVAVWAGSFARKSRLLANAGQKRLSKHKKKARKTKFFFAKRAKRAKRRALRAGKPPSPYRPSSPKAKSELANWQYDYMRRNEVLQRLGFATYADYLASPQWRIIRQRVLKRDRYKCHGCGNEAIQVHHQQYTKPVLMGDDIEPLVAICVKCHKGIELNANGDKVSLAAANSRLQAIRTNRLYRASA
jgi:hypothetical protein